MKYIIYSDGCDVKSSQYVLQIALNISERNLANAAVQLETWWLMNTTSQLLEYDNGLANYTLCIK